MRQLLLSIFLFTIVIFTSCSHGEHKLDIEKILANAVAKYPALPKGEGKFEVFYHLVRSLGIGNTGVELQLRSSPDSLDDPQQIIIVINKAKEKYAIPFYSNTYHDYWNFEFDSVLTSVTKINTTFEKELKNCFEKLNLYDSTGTASKVIDEMFYSLLRCEPVRKNDSTNINGMPVTNNYNLPNESSDSCFKRNKKNWQAIVNEIYPEKYIVNRNTFWDDKNKRVYQFNFTGRKQKGKFQLDFKTYRLDCIMQMIYI